MRLLAAHPPARAYGVVAVVASLSLAGISGCSSTQSASHPTPVAQTIVPAVTVPIPPVTVNVIDPGDGPREVLRNHAASGVTQNVTLRTLNTVRQSINSHTGQDFSTPASVIRLTAVTTPTGVDLEIGSISGPDTAVSSTPAQPMTGLRARLLMSKSGAVTALRIGLPVSNHNGERAPSQVGAHARSILEKALNEAIYQSIVFPDQPIGVGAKWTIRQQLPVGVPTSQVTTATLTSRTGNQAKISVEVHQVPRSNEWDVPNGVLNVDDYHMAGSGTVTVDLGLPLPVSGLVTIGGDQTYSNPRDATKLTQSAGTVVSWSSN